MDGYVRSGRCCCAGSGENIGVSIVNYEDQGNVNRLLSVRRGRGGCSSGSTCCSNRS